MEWKLLFHFSLFSIYHYKYICILKNYSYILFLILFIDINTSANCNYYQTSFYCNYCCALILSQRLTQNRNNELLDGFIRS